ncbi:hypothetical protein BLOT_013531 [Blomia tropicalis]|nr:hypothetical protein BLOT_013531 [Blomia tropicalis]
MISTSTLNFIPNPKLQFCSSFIQCLHSINSNLESVQTERSGTKKKEKEKEEANSYKRSVPGIFILDF